MSTLNITDLLRELQAGEEARAKIPQLEAFNTQLTADINKANSRNMGLEENIIGYKRTIETLTQKVARLEVERDDAGFRELEATERVTTLTNTLRALAANVTSMVHDVDPPTPEPMPQPIVQDASVPMTEANWKGMNVPITDHGAERATDPTEHGAQLQSALTQPSVHSGDTVGSAEGQSAADPTASSTAATLPFASGDGASASEPVHSPKTEEYRPFGGDVTGEVHKPTNTGDYPAAKRWYNKPDTMSIADWVATGGQP